MGCTLAYGTVPRTRLSKDDWTAMAMTALAEGGVAAVGIEPMAARLGTTKGSAYWHFPTREALLRATLERWEAAHTVAVIDLVEAERDPARRLRRLFASVLEPSEGHAVELALLASADDPLVGEALRRVAERRIAYLADQFGILGHPPEAARRRAVLSYSAYLGHAQLLRTAPGALPAARDERRAYLDESMRLLLGGVA